MNSSIYVFSVGINNYKSSRISNLSGCIKDVFELKKKLQSIYSVEESNYTILLDQQATRQNIINTFRKHFSRLRDEDILFFHFSGHGSWEMISEPFVEAEIQPPGTRNELLVTYDSRTDNILPIADKELRWLLAEIQQTTSLKNLPNGIKAFFLFDCCHSGSMLRFEGNDVKIRTIDGVRRPRSVEEYLEGQVSSTQLPTVNYLSLSACSPKESAIENDQGGLFTRAFLNALEGNEKIKSFADLYFLTRNQLRLETNNRQHPFIEYSGQINPNAPFLWQGGDTHEMLISLVQVQEQWLIPFGAIHGSNRADEKYKNIPIICANSSVQIGYTSIKEVQLEHSILTTESFLTDNMTESPNFYAIIIQDQLPIHLSRNSDNSLVIDLFLDTMRNSSFKDQFLISSSASYLIDYQVSNKTIIIRYETENTSFEIYGITQTDLPAIRHILSQLSKIRKWEQICTLTHPRYSSIQLESLDWRFEYQNANEQQQSVELLEKANSALTLFYSSKTGGIPYRFTLINKTDKQLHCFLIHLSSNFDIYQKHEEYTKPLYIQEKRLIYDSISNQTGLGISDSTRKEIVDTFILIASTKILDIPFVFEQRAFGAFFGKKANSIEDWVQNSNIFDRAEVSLGVQNEVNWTIKKLSVRIVNLDLA